MEFERITVTKRGIEVQQQLKQMLGFKEHKQQGVLRKNEYSENLLSKQKEQEICNSNFLDTNLITEQQMKVFLTNRFSNGQKYIKNEMEKYNKKKKKFGGSFQSESHRSFKCLDFRQIWVPFKGVEQTYYEQQRDLFQVSKPEGHEMNQGEDKNLAYQQARIQRMIRKHEQFNEQTSNIPNYGKGTKRDENFMSDLLKSMEKRESSTRVESIKEINQNFGEKVDLLEYQNLRKERFQERMSQIHFNKYEKLWMSLRVGK